MYTPHNDNREEVQPYKQKLMSSQLIDVLPNNYKNSNVTVIRGICVYVCVCMLKNNAYVLCEEAIQ